MTTLVTLQIDVRSAQELREGAVRSRQSRELHDALEALGLDLTAMHPGTDDPGLSRFFTVDVPEGRDPQEIAARLRRFAAVEGAYVKPPDELP